MNRILPFALCACFACSSAFAADAPKADAGDKTSREASKLTFDFKNTPLAEVVQRLAEKSGNKPFLLSDPMKDKTVTLKVLDLSYWQAVDKIADQTGAIYLARWMTADGELLLHGMMGAPVEQRLALLEAEKDAKLTGYAGPAVVKVDSIGKLLLLRTAKVPAWGAPQTEGLSLGLAYFWEDRLDPLTEEIELTKIQTSKKEDLLPAASEARRKMRPAMMGPGPKWGPNALALFNLAMPAPDTRLIAEVDGIVRLEFATGEREVRIDDVFNKVDKEIKVDDWTIVIRKVANNQGALVLSVEVKCKGEPMELPTWWTTGSYGWYVQKGEGDKRTRGVTYGGGRQTMVGGGAWTGPIKTVNPQPAGGAQKKGEGGVMFVGNFEEGASVVLVLPKFHETKEYPFVIKDIPLP